MGKSTVATWMKAAGYQTAVVGKYLNGYGVGQHEYVPPGWDSWQVMTKLLYYGPWFSIDGKLVKYPSTVYQV